MVKLKVKIFNLEKVINVFVVDDKDFPYEFLIGLDCIYKFKLRQDENGRISQNENKENQEKKERNRITEKNKYEVNFNENINDNTFDAEYGHLNIQEKTEIRKLIEKYKTVFAKDKYDVGTVRDYEAHIELILDKYCYKRPYRCTIEDRREIESQIDKLLDRGLIEESYSPFAAPVTLAYKKEDNRKSRLCIDFRELNKIVVPQSQPFPLIEDLMVKTVNCKYFTTLDINSAFWSIPLKIQDRYKTAFVTQEGHFQWTCLPFGLKTSPAIFQRILSNIIRKYKLNDNAVNFIDDIIIFSKTFNDHLKHISGLLEAILEEGFRLKFTKCKFARNYAKYLGHIISDNSIKPLKDYLAAVKEFPTPKTKKNVRQFLGKINFHNKFIPRNAIILDPLHNLLRKDVRFNWTQECQEAFKKIRELMCAEPILKIFDPEKKIEIFTDASIEGLGAVLKQKDEKEISRPVAYFSKKLKDYQKKRKAIYLECLAIKEAVKYWQHWLMGREFVIYSDHRPLENMNIKARPDEELGDLMFYLSQYNFKIIYNPGKFNQEADCLSRNPVLEPHENEEDCLKVVNMTTIQEIKKDQDENQDIKRNNNRIIVREGIYMKKSKKKEKIVVSEKLGKKIIEDVHKLFCHLGKTQMQNKITEVYCGKNLLTNIKKFCENCEVCIRNKTRRKPKYGLMSQLGPPEKPFEIVSIDTIGGCGGSRSTKKYLHLLVDHFTRFAYILTSKTQNAGDFKKLINKVLTSYKIQTILTDQYPGINSKEFKEYVNSERIELIFTAVDAPFSNGINERLNQTLVNKIRCKINEKDQKLAWTTIAKQCVEMYNNTEHTVTKFTPRYLLEGKQLEILPPELEPIFSGENLEKDREIAFLNTIKSHNSNKERFDKNRKILELKVGDQVYVENGNKLNRKKLEELRIGPYKVLKRISKSIYEIDTGHKKPESNKFHITKLSPVAGVN
ncbi:hypothetical protein TKK_0015274 [Trichogramma kaykai]|uniref:RNA-directed DNA polymerase n=2 Tax=Trichogramma kaykai TaxID=54128 RepID=A0ABD2W9F6_9HYME